MRAVSNKAANTDVASNLFAKQQCVQPQVLATCKCCVGMCMLRSIFLWPKNSAYSKRDCGRTRRAIELRFFAYCAYVSSLFIYTLQKFLKCKLTRQFQLDYNNIFSDFLHSNRSAAHAESALQAPPDTHLDGNATAHHHIRPGDNHHAVCAGRG